MKLLILNAINIPCPACLADLELELQRTSKAEPSATIRTVYCEHRKLALMACLEHNRIGHWQIWPVPSIEALMHELGQAEAQIAAALARQNAQGLEH